MGSTFDVSVIINTQGEAVNTIEVELKFPADKLQIANPSLGKSIVQLWPSPPVFDNRSGKIYFIGGIPTPGITTSEGIVQTFTFRVVSPGQAHISFGENTSVLANDGQGTDVLKQTSPAAFSLILPPAQGPEIFSPTHPEQGTWYNSPDPLFKWTSVTQSQGFSYSINQDANSAPDTELDTLDAEASITGLESGIWYFHVREKAGGSWGGVSHFAVNIDALSPAAFGVNVSPSPRTSNKSPILRFFTTDSLSGFDHFELKLVSLKDGPTDTTFFFEVASPYQLSALKAGRYEVIVRAYDIAGNFIDETATLNILSTALQFITPEGVDFILFFAPWDIVLPLMLLLILITFGFVVVAWRRHKHHLGEALKEHAKNRRPIDTRKLKHG